MHLAFLSLLVALPLDRATVQSAAKAYDQARYETVIKLLRDGDTSSLEKNDAGQALFMLGVSELALGNDSLSQKAFIKLFSDVADFEVPPYTAKKVLSAIDRARKQVVIGIRSEMQGQNVKVCGTGLPRRAQVKIVFTTSTGEEGAIASPDGANCFSAAPTKTSGVNGYYVNVSIDGDVRATAGSRTWPLAYEPVREAIKPPPPKPAITEEGGTPWYKHWATWTVIGVLVAGGVTAGIVVATLPKSGTINVQFSPPQGSTP